jgi:hypothetical protein
MKCKAGADLTCEYLILAIFGPTRVSTDQVVPVLSLDHKIYSPRSLSARHFASGQYLHAHALGDTSISIAVQVDKQQAADSDVGHFETNGNLLWIQV